MKTKMQRKPGLRRTFPAYVGSIQKFMMPPAVLVFRELRRLELMDRPSLGHNLHHID